MADVEIGIRELRSDLSNHVKKAAGGETVVITIGGEPTARLTPLASNPVETMEDAYASGRVIRAMRRGETPPPSPRKVVLDRPGEEIIDELREERI